MIIQKLLGVFTLALAGSLTSFSVSVDAMPRLYVRTILAQMVQFESGDESSPVEDNPLEEEDESPLQEESEQSSQGESFTSTGEEFILTITIPQYQTIPAIDFENRQTVDRQSSEADFGLKSNDPNSAGANYSIEGMNGAVVAPAFPGHLPMSVPAEGYSQIGMDVAQDVSIPCKTRSGRYCELRARYTHTAEGNDLTLTVKMYGINE